MTAAGRAGGIRRFGLATAGAIGVPVYFGIEALVRVMNLGQRRDLSEAEVKLIEEAMATDDAEASVLLGLATLSEVSVVTPARLPTKHRGMTLGRTIFVKGGLDMDSARDRELLVHEMVHVAQRERSGRVGMAWSYSRLYADGFSYSDHELEVEARAVADAVLG